MTSKSKVPIVFSFAIVSYRSGSGDNTLTAGQKHEKLADIVKERVERGARSDQRQAERLSNLNAKQKAREQRINELEKMQAKRYASLSNFKKRPVEHTFYDLFSTFLQFQIKTAKLSPNWFGRSRRST